MADILDDLRAYLAGDNAVVFSPRRVAEMIAAFDGLRAELAAEREAGQVFLAENEDLRRQRDQADECKASHQRICMTVMADLDALRAELAAERKILSDYREKWTPLCLERDELRELLRNAALAKARGE